MHLIDSWNTQNEANADFANMIAAAIRLYKSAGITERQKVVFMMPSSSDWIIQYMALDSVRAIIIPIDSDDTEQTNHKIRLSAAEYVISSQPLSNEILTLEYNRVSSLDNDAIVIYKSNECREKVSNCHMMIFTSGTDGAVKLAMLSRESIDMVINYYVNEFVNYKFDTIIIALPLSAIYTIAICLAGVKANKTIVFANPKSQDIFSVVIKYRVNLFPAVPLVVEAIHSKVVDGLSKQIGLVRLSMYGLMHICMQIRRFTNFNLGRYVFSFIHHKSGPDLKVILSGGAKIPAHILYRMYGLGYTIFEGYGLTETSGVVTVRKGEYETIGTVGKPINDVTISVGSDADRNEILIKTKQLFSGYHKSDEKSVHLIGGAFKTGDIGYLDSKNNLIINGRIKNIIVLASEKKIIPERLEEQIQKNTNINNPVVLGIGTPNSFGDEVILFIEKSSLSKPIEELTVDHINKNLSQPYYINGIVFVEKFPRNKLGKCCRKKLKDYYVQEIQ